MKTFNSEKDKQKYLASSKSIEYFNKLDKTTNININEIHFLVQKLLPKDMIIRRIDNVDFTVHDIDFLNQNELFAFFNKNSKKDLLDWCADNSYKTSNLLGLVVSKLITNFAKEVHAQYISYKEPILHIAANIGDTASIYRILAHVEGQNSLSLQAGYYLDTPLHRAAKNGHSEIIAIMLKHSKGIEALSKQNKSYETPLHCAAANGHKAVISEILKHTEGIAALSIKDNYGYTALHLASRKRHTTIIAEILKYTGGIAALSIKDNYGYTALHWAAHFKFVTIIAEILKHTEGIVTLFIKDNSGNTPLHFATISGYTTEATTQMQNYIDEQDALSIQCNYGWLSQYFANRKEHIASITEILIHIEAFHLLFVKNNEGKTPYDILTEQKEIDLAPIISTSFQSNLSDQDKHRLLQSISTHLAVNGPNYTSTSQLLTHVETTTENIIYNNEYNRLLNHVITNLNKQQSGEIEKI